MDKTAILRKKKSKEPKIPINIKISSAASKWLKENKYSPTGIFLEALKDLGFKESESSGNPFTKNR